MLGFFPGLLDGELTTCSYGGGFVGGAILIPYAKAWQSD